MGRQSRRDRPTWALAVIRAVSRIVPGAQRREWRREWEGEVWGRWSEMSETDRRGWRSRGDLLWRALGGLGDAWELRRGVAGREGDSRRGRGMEGMGMDLRVAGRSLLRTPAFSAVVVLTLAVGIGANTTIFALARDVVLRPFPYPDPDRVVAVVGVSEGFLGGTGNVSYPNMADLAEATPSLAGVASLRWWGPALEAEEGSVVLRGATVTANFFTLLGVTPGVGRFFRPDEEGTGRAPTVVLSHGLWMERFGGDPDVVGRTLRLNGAAYEVIGVTAETFEDPWILGSPGAAVRLWRTVDSPPTEWPRGGRSWRALGRLAPGVSLAAASADAEGTMAGLASTFPEENAGRHVELVPLRERIAGPTRPVMVLLAGSVALLLVVACVNLANLMLGRALDRGREFAVQRALGASGWRMARRSLAEALFLATVGGVLGLCVAWGLGQGVVHLGSAFLPRDVTGGLDVGILGFAAALTLVTGLLFGLAPALQAARALPVAPGREEGGRGHTGGRRGRRLQRGLVVAEVAMTAMLLVGSGLLLSSLHRLGSVDVGIRTPGVVTLELHGSAWAGLDPEAAADRWRQVLDAVRSVPGVEEAGAMDYLPLSGSFSCDGIARADRPPPAPGEGQCAETRSVLPGALEALGVRLDRGRMPGAQDAADAPPVAVIDRALAETLWPGEDPLGMPVTIHGRSHEVVGVVADVRHFGPAGVVRPSVYLPAPQEGWNGAARGLTLVVRTAPGTPGLVPALRTGVWGVDPGIAFGEIRNMDDLRAENLAGPRFRTILVGAFGGTAVLLAMLGVGGVLARSVHRRTREMGVRMAVGADPGSVRALILREGLMLVALGLGIGLLGALAGARLIEALLFQVTARDPVVFGGVALLMALLGTAAAWLPARVAAGVDPAEALAAD